MASLDKKSLGPYLNKKLDVVVHAYHPSYARSINKRIGVQDGLSIKPFLKNKEGSGAQFK